MENQEVTEKRGPGRPKKETRAGQEKKQRRMRSDMSMGRLMRLSFPEDCLDRTKFRYRVINDKQGGRLQDLTDSNYDNWSFVTKQEMQETSKRNRGDPYDARKDTDPGEKVSRIVGTHQDGTSMRGYLCKKPIDWFEEDIQKAQAHITEQESMMKHGPPVSEEGLHGETSYALPGNTIRRETT